MSLSLLCLQPTASSPSSGQLTNQGSNKQKCLKFLKEIPRRVGHSVVFIPAKNMTSSDPLQGGGKIEVCVILLRERRREIRLRLSMSSGSWRSGDERLCLGAPGFSLLNQLTSFQMGVSNTRGDCQSVQHSFLLRFYDKIASPVLELAARDDNIIYQMLRLESRVLVYCRPSP